MCKPVRFPEIRFEVLDVIKTPERLLEISPDCSVVALDINGNRSVRQGPPDSLQPQRA